MASKLTASQGLEILYFDRHNWDGTEKIDLDSEYWRWCDEDDDKLDKECWEIMVPFSWTIFDPSEFEKGMPTRYRNGWVEMLLTCANSECTRNSGQLINIPLPDNKEDYDICLSVLGEEPKVFHNIGTRFLSSVKQ